MDRNTFTGLFLIMLIIFGSFYLLSPSKEQIKKQAYADSLKQAAAAKAKAPAIRKTDTATTKEAAVQTDTAHVKGVFGETIDTSAQKFITLENNDIRLELTTRGGRIYSVQLKKFKNYFNKPLVLFEGNQNQFGLKFLVDHKDSVNTNDLYFAPSIPNLIVAEKDSGSVTMRLSYSPTQYIDYIYTLNGTGYNVGFTIKETGLDGVIANDKSIDIDWAASLRKQEKDIEQERYYTNTYFKTTDGNVDYLSARSDDQKVITSPKTQWVSFKAHFFSSLLLSPSGFSKASLVSSTDTSDHEDLKEMSARLILDRNSAGVYPMSFYFEPLQFNSLQKLGYDMEKQIDLGWGPLKYINRFAVLPVFDFLKQFNWNYGFIILALTILLKLVLSPLTYKSYLSMAKMRIIKPEMDEIKAKVGDDNPTQLQQEYLKLYKKAGVNPLGGCLPMIIQMPIVIAFFRFFPGLFELRGQSFLWMHDLSTYDSFITWHTSIPFIGNHLSLMCLLMTISTLIYTYFNNQISGATGQMKYIGYITPILFIGFLNSYPAGLNYYYFLANMFTFAQQYLIRLMVDDKKIHEQIQENKKKPEVKKKKSAFQARMDEMMKQKQLEAAKAKKK